MKKLFLYAMIGGVSLLTACADDNNNSPTCVTDNECKGDRICSAGVCAAPEMTDTADMGASDQGSTPPADQGTPADQGSMDMTPDQGTSLAGLGEPCTVDENCDAGAGLVCSVEEQLCIETCIDDLDCAVEEVCVPRANGDRITICQSNSDYCDDDEACETGQVCVSNSCIDREDECTEDGDCNGVNEVCEPESVQDPTLVCKDRGTVYHWIQIQDTSTGFDACEQTDPGSDLMGARLVDNTGQTLGWASAGNESYGDSGFEINIYDSSERLDGTAHGFEGRECPDPGSRLSELMPPPMSLGCGGWVLLEFLDAQGEQLDILPGMSIEVLEYGSSCGGSMADAYEIYLCENSLDANNGSASSCFTIVGGVQEGFTSVIVP